MFGIDENHGPPKLNKLVGKIDILINKVQITNRPVHRQNEIVINN